MILPGVTMAEMTNKGKTTATNGVGADWLLSMVQEINNQLLIDIS